MKDYCSYPYTDNIKVMAFKMISCVISMSDWLLLYQFIGRALCTSHADMCVVHPFGGCYAIDDMI
jgi:hypothetical protein